MHQVSILLKGTGAGSLHSVAPRSAGSGHMAIRREWNCMGTQALKITLGKNVGVLSSDEVGENRLQQVCAQSLCGCTSPDNPSPGAQTWPEPGYQQSTCCQKLLDFLAHCLAAWALGNKLISTFCTRQLICFLLCAAGVCLALW